MTPVNSNKTIRIRQKSIAPCGMNCQLCRAYRPDKAYIKACPGCRGDDTHKSRSCVTCRIKNCEQMVTGGFKYCFSCDSYPCARLKHLDQRYRTRYGMSMIDNLESIRQSGIRQFIRIEQDKWTCPQCGELICVHRPNCLACGYQWH
ncbi:MAG TPA: DUF3795 domain-containing protein [Anaerolineae bacterium]|nr:DUF3795 domain-containing protein [Anaerolineae bacterium]